LYIVVIQLISHSEKIVKFGNFAYNKIMQKVV